MNKKIMKKLKELIELTTKDTNYYSTNQIIGNKVIYVEIKEKD